MQSPFLLRGRFGLGDNIYQLPIVEEFCRVHHDREVYLRTPWPQLYKSVLYRNGNLRLFPSDTNLRDCKANETRQKRLGVYDPLPAKWLEGEAYELNYRSAMMADPDLDVFGGLATSIGVEPRVTGGVLTWFTATPDARKVIGDGRLILARPASLRTEWPCQSRNPRPRIIADVLDVLRHARNGRTCRFVSVANLDGVAECLADGELPFRIGHEIDEAFEHGQIDIDAVLTAASSAVVLVGPPGWIIPFSIVRRIPAIIVFGGHTKPACLIPDWCDWIMPIAPEPFCDCRDNYHDCEKRLRFDARAIAVWADRHIPEGPRR